jgi:hypothetical protein
MEMVTAEIRRFAKEHEGRLLCHDIEAIQLLNNSELLCTLKRTKPFEAGSMNPKPQTWGCVTQPPTYYQ